MTTKKFFAVEVFDNTCNVMGHESGIYGKGDYSWITDTLNGGDGAEYNMTKAEAEEVKADFERMIKEYMLDWASVEVDEMEIDEDEEEESPVGTLKIQDVTNYIREKQVGINAIVLEDASRYASNARGEMTCVGTLFTKKYMQNPYVKAEVIQTGNKETSITAVEEQLKVFIGKGNVIVKFLDGTRMEGEVVA